MGIFCYANCVILTSATTGFMAAKLGFFMIPPFTEGWLPSKCKGFHEIMIGYFHPAKIGDFRPARNG